MVPWEQVLKISTSLKTAQILEVINGSPHSRIPVTDRDGNIKGILQIRKFLKAYIKQKHNVILASVIDYPYYVSADTPIDELLTEMSNHRRNLAVVKDNDGTVLGGNEREDCKIDAIAQSFAMITADKLSLDKSHVKKAMQAVYDILFDKKNKLVRLLYPPFDKDTQSPGYIKGYVPGIRENGGQYTHAAVWTALGFFAGEENDKGAEILFAINPAVHGADEELAKQYKVEPYVLAGDVYANPAHMGRGGWSWYTGSAAWYRKVAMEVLCGYTERI